MKIKTVLMGFMAVCSAFELSAMPTKEEAEKAAPVVQKLLAPERAALKAGTKTRSQVADEAMKIASEVNSDAVKMLLIKGAFVLYVKDNKLEKAAETIAALKKTIPDISTDDIRMVVDSALADAHGNVRSRLNALLDAAASRDTGMVEGKEKIGDYTWSYRVQNGEATIIAEKGGRFSCAVSPVPMGRLTIPPMINGVKVTRIGREAFRHCDGMSEVEIPDGVTYIGRDAFADCNGLTSVVIPPNVEYLDWGAFGNCSILSSVSLPSGLKSIGQWVFTGCRPLKSIEIPPSVRDIQGGAFMGCYALSSVTIPQGVTSIGNGTIAGFGTFRYCTGLNTVTIPASVTNIDEMTFVDTCALKSIQVDGNNRHYKSENGMLLTKDGQKLVRGVNGVVTVPATVKNIARCAFEGCQGLQSVVLPSGAENIGDFTFKNCCALQSLTIPAAVTNIGNHAFCNCSELSSLKLCGEKPAVSNSSFIGCNKLTEIHVPANAKSWAGMKKWQGKTLIFDTKVD